MSRTEACLRHWKCIFASATHIVWMHEVHRARYIARRRTRTHITVINPAWFRTPTFSSDWRYDTPQYAVSRSLAGDCQHVLVANDDTSNRRGISGHLSVKSVKKSGDSFTYPWTGRYVGWRGGAIHIGGVLGRIVSELYCSEYRGVALR